MTARLPNLALWRIPLLVFVVAALASGSLALYLARSIEAKERAAFDADVAASTDAMRERFETTITLLRGAAGLFGASEEVTRPEFASYVERLNLRERYPGILGLGFSRRVPAGERAGLEALMRLQGMTSFRVWPEHPRDEMHSIVYLEPMDERNRAAIGFDMTTDPTRRAAMSLARDRGEAQASGPVTLVQEITADKQPGVLIYAPVYAGRGLPQTVEARRTALLGFVYSPLRLRDLLGGVSGSGIGRVDYEIFDVQEEGPPKPMLSTREADAKAARFTAERTLDVPGRTWQLRFSSRPEFESVSQHGVVPWLVPVALATSLLLAGISFVQVRARRVAEEAAEEQRRNQAALRESEERERVRSARLQQLAEASPMLNATRSLDELARAVEQVACRLLEAPAARLTLDTTAHGDAHDGSMRVPLAAGGDGGEGVLSVAARDGEPWSEHDRLLLQHLAGIASIALRNARLYAELRENDRRKDEFLATLAHELRNPLAPIRTSLEIIRRGPGTDAAERARSIAERQTRHMVRLIDDLLDVARISRGTIVLNKELVSLRAVIASAIETSQPLIDARRHELRVGSIDTAWVLNGDPTRLAQIFSNLLNNAASYTPDGGSIWIEASSTSGFVHVVVGDSGIGLAQEQLDAVFDMFVRAGPTLPSAGGLGVGLTLVRRLAQLHGGDVHARSHGVGRGSEFIVSLPLCSVERPAPERAESRPAPGSTPQRVLVVDDNRDAAESLAQLLSADGHEVRIAHDGEQALRTAEAFRPQVVLLDIGLPDLDGYEIARRLRAQRGDAVRLIAITGWGQAADRLRAREAGFDVHLVKPIDYMQLAGQLAGSDPQALSR
ncbi:two-component system, sensor histidine kinase ChiS [Burkholderiaceae bacterium]|nr:two-component system, sensor histidine kinase ChiS [Burkholderiaceae bacterium]